MGSLKSQIGQQAGPFEEEISQQRIARFCSAIGVQQTQVAPPTFLTLFRKGEFELLQRLGIPLSRVLHAEQEYWYESSVQAGDRIKFQTSITQVLEKHGSTFFMQFITMETTFHAERDSGERPVGRAKNTIVIREKVN